MDPFSRFTLQEENDFNACKKTILATNYTQLYESNKSRKSIEFQAFQALVKKEYARTNEIEN